MRKWPQFLALNVVWSFTQSAQTKTGFALEESIAPICAQNTGNAKRTISKLNLVPFALRMWKLRLDELFSNLLQPQRRLRLVVLRQLKRAEKLLSGL